VSDEIPEAPGTVGVIGAGLMGHGIAQVFMAAGSKVRVWDPDLRALERVPSRIEGHLEDLGLSGTVDLELAPSLERAVSQVDLVVEAIPEQLDLKLALIHELDRLAPGAIIASNTSVLRISEIAEGSQRPDRVVGAHWWNPPYLIPIVEVVRGSHTSDDCVASVTEWLRAVGKMPVLVHHDVPGFIGNRMQFALWREAMSIVEQGICDAATVDLVARNTFGARLTAMGPLENADYIGLDLTKSIMDYLSAGLSNDTEAPGIVARAVMRGDLGAKTGQGFFPWSEGSREVAERGLLAHLMKTFQRKMP
jgi:3-hydroxybutyryl-CoA dehydrogenase